MSNQEMDDVDMTAGASTPEAMPAPAESIAPSLQYTDIIVDDTSAAATTALDEEEKVIEDDSLSKEAVVDNSQGACTSESNANLEPKTEETKASEEHMEKAPAPSPIKEAIEENETPETAIKEEISQIQSEEEGFKSDSAPVQDDKDQAEASKTQKENEPRPEEEEQPEANQTPPTPKVCKAAEVEHQNSMLTGESETDMQSPVTTQPAQQQQGGIIIQEDAAPVDKDNGDECESGDVDEDASCSLHGGGGAGSVQENENIASPQQEPNTSAVVETVVGASTEASVEEVAAIAPMAAETTPAETADRALTSNDEEVTTEAKVMKSAEEDNHEKENDMDNNEASAVVTSSSKPPPPEITPAPFVNEGLLRWEMARKSWLSHQQRGGSGDEDDSSFSCKPAAPAIPLDVDEIIDVIFASPRQWRVNEGGPRSFPQPVPLPQLVDLLQDLWEAEGIDP